MSTISIDSKNREELIDITDKVQAIVSDSEIEHGICHLWCHHTTAGITINENSDPDVKNDLLMAFDRIISYDWPYRHAEGNSPAHMKSSLIGCSLNIPIENNRLILGAWQGIMFAEFDGPRQNRRITVTLIPNCG